MESNQTLSMDSSISSTMDQIESALFGENSILSLPLFTKIQNQEIKKTAKDEVFKLIVVAYTKLYEFITKNYPNLTNLIKYTPEQLNILLI